MKCEGEAEVAAPRLAVWQTLMDPTAMSRVVPGCRQLAETSPGEFQARMRIGVSALRGNFTGTLRLSDLNPPAACRFLLHGRGSIGEFAGGGSLRLEEGDGKTSLVYVADLTLGGPLARMGESLLQTIARTLIAQGLKNLAGACLDRGAPGRGGEGTLDSTLVSITPIARRLVEDYLRVRRGEFLLVVVDTLTSREIPTALMAQAVALGSEPVVTTMPPRARSGEDPPPQVAAAMKAANVIVAAASTSVYHTRAKAEAQRAGARGVLNAPHLAEAWANGAMTADFRQIRPMAERLRDLLKTGKQLHLTSPTGTDVTAVIEGRKPVGWLTAICREPGQISALPGGEVSLPPVEGSAEGRVVIEHVMSDLGPIETPLELVVQGGHVIEVRGGTPAQAERLREILHTVPNATNIAEIGIGLNPRARLTDQITETKKRLGTAHIAIGDNAREYGGSVECDAHLDGMILDVTIELDGVTLVDRGRPVFFE